MGEVPSLPAPRAPRGAREGAPWLSVPSGPASRQRFSELSEVPFCSNESTLSPGGRFPGPLICEFIPTGRAGSSSESPLPARGLGTVWVPAAPVSEQTSPPAASPRGAGEPAAQGNSRGAQPRAGTALPHRPSVPREPPRFSTTRTRAGGRNCPGSGPNGGVAALASRPRARAGVMAERRPQAKFPGS